MNPNASDFTPSFMRAATPTTSQMTSVFAAPSSTSAPPALTSPFSTTSFQSDSDGIGRGRGRGRGGDKPARGRGRGSETEGRGERPRGGRGGIRGDRGDRGDKPTRGRGVRGDKPRRGGREGAVTRATIPSTFATPFERGDFEMDSQQTQVDDQDSEQPAEEEPFSPISFISSPTPSSFSTMSTPPFPPAFTSTTSPSSSSSTSMGPPALPISTGAKKAQTHTDSITKGLELLREIKEAERPAEKLRSMNLSEAHALVGTCLEWCPTKERIERQIFKDLSIFEILAGTEDDREPQADPRTSLKKYHRPSVNLDAVVTRPDEVRPPQGDNPFQTFNYPFLFSFIPCFLRFPLSSLYLTFFWLLEVLSDVMDYLIEEVMTRTDVSYREIYHFVRDRTRAIRQDLIFQKINSPLSVDIHEKIARFHIVSEFRLCEEESSSFDSFQDTEQLTKVLTTLRLMCKSSFLSLPG
jgi:hypothetical protein